MELLYCFDLIRRVGTFVTQQIFYSARSLRQEKMIWCTQSGWDACTNLLNLVSTTITTAAAALQPNTQKSGGREWTRDMQPESVKTNRALLWKFACHSGICLYVVMMCPITQLLFRAVHCNGNCQFVFISDIKGSLQWFFHVFFPPYLEQFFMRWLAFRFMWSKYVNLSL